MLRDVKLHDTWSIFGKGIFDLLLYAGFSDGPVFKFSNLALVAIKSLNDVASSFLLGMQLSLKFNFNLQDGEGKYRWWYLGKGYWFGLKGKECLLLVVGAGMGMGEFVGG